MLYPILLLLISNTFMTFAWYGHLKFTHAPLMFIILISWLIAFFEYLFQVPANRIGYNYFSITELRVIQECVSLFVFILFSILYLGEALKWNQVVGLSITALGVLIVFYK